LKRWKVASAALLILLVAGLSLWFLWPHPATYELDAEMWVESSTRWVLADAEPPANPSCTSLLYAARGEWESFQLCLCSSHPLDGVRVEATPLTGLHGSIPASQIHLYRAFHLQVGNTHQPYTTGPGWYPDILVPFTNPETGQDLTGPMDANPFNLQADRTEVVWVEVRVPMDAVPGWYRGYLVVTAGQAAALVEIKLKVWNLTLPEHTTLQSSFWLDEEQITRIYDIDLEQNPAPLYALCRQYYEFMLEHNLMPAQILDASPGYLEDGTPDFSWQAPGLNVNFSEAIEHYLELGLNCYEIPLGNYTFDDPFGADRDRVKKYVQGFQNWFEDRGLGDYPFAYIIDEPMSAQDYHVSRLWGDLLHEADPDFRFLLTEQPTPEDPSWGSLVGYVDIWSPQSVEIDEEEVQVLLERVAAGEEIWPYTAVRYPGTISWGLDVPLTSYHLIPWLSALLNGTGILYWVVNYWNEVDDPLNQTPYWWTPSFPCSGVLLYPGLSSRVGFDGPLPSLRLKVLRDGIEDYEYLRMHRQQCGDHATDLLIHRIITSGTNFTHDPQNLQETRLLIADALVNGTTKKSGSADYPSPVEAYSAMQPSRYDDKLAVMGGIMSTSGKGDVRPQFFPPEEPISLPAGETGGHRKALKSTNFRRPSTGDDGPNTL